VLYSHTTHHQPSATYSFSRSSCCRSTSEQQAVSGQQEAVGSRQCLDTEQQYVQQPAAKVERRTLLLQLAACYLSASSSQAASTLGE
jgi:hypothetical protein